MYPIGFILGYFIGRKMFRLEKIKLEWVDNLFIIIFISGMIGARLGHVFFYDWDYFKQHPTEIFKTWHGGLASHGGTIGVMLALFIWSSFVKKPYLWILDKVVVCAALLAGLIRLGNLMNSEIYGIATQLPWGFVFLQNGETIPKHPTQLYESIIYFVCFLILYRSYFIDKAYQKQGLLTGVFGLIVFGSRFFIEFIKNPQVQFEEGMILNMGQLLSLPFILYATYLIYKARKTELKI